MNKMYKSHAVVSKTDSSEVQWDLCSWRVWGCRLRVESRQNCQDKTSHDINSSQDSIVDSRGRGSKPKKFRLRFILCGEFISTDRFKFTKIVDIKCWVPRVAICQRGRGASDWDRMRFFSTKKVINHCSRSGQAFARNGRQYHRMLINVEDFSGTSLLRFGWFQSAGRRISNAKFLNGFLGSQTNMRNSRSWRATQKHQNAVYTQEERDPSMMDRRMEVGERHLSVYVCELCWKRATTSQVMRRWLHSAKHKGKKETKISYPLK